jgi:hypothetical protein
MNIFILDNDPKLAAQYHCDKHVVKMTIESMQVMGSAMWASQGITTKKQILALGSEKFDIWRDFPRLDKEGIVSPYGVGFMNHPSTKWARESQKNWEWLVNLTLELTSEHAKRWGRNTSCLKIVEWFANNVPSLDKEEMTPYYQAVPIELKTDDAVHSYRLYYAGWKEYFAKWKTNPPYWWREYLELSVKENKLSEQVMQRYRENKHAILVG